MHVGFMNMELMLTPPLPYAPAVLDDEEELFYRDIIEMEVFKGTKRY